MRRIVLAVSAAGLMTVMAGPSPAPAQAQPPTLTVAGVGWSVPLTPTVKAPKDRVIEIRDLTTGWYGYNARTFLDRFTASRMVPVHQCSGTAYRCVTIRFGKVKGTVGYSHGSTITIDQHKAMTTYGRYYRLPANRGWLIAHELGHQFGLRHSSGRNMMNPVVNRHRMVLTSSQRAQLRNR